MNLQVHIVQLQLLQRISDGIVNIGNATQHLGCDVEFAPVKSALFEGNTDFRLIVVGCV